MLLTTSSTQKQSSSPSSIRANDKDGLLSNILVFQCSTNVKGKNKYWQFCINPQQEQDVDYYYSSSSSSTCYYLQSRHGTTTKNLNSGKINTTGGACYQKAFPSELQAQKELLSRIHSKLSEGYVWICNKRTRKFPLDELIQQVNDKLQEQFDMFKNMFSTRTTDSTTTTSLPRVASPQRFTNMLVRRMGLSPSRNIPHLKTRIDERRSKQMDKSFSREQLLKLRELSSSESSSSSEEEENEDIDQRTKINTRKNRQQKRRYKSSSSSSSSEEANVQHSEDDDNPTNITTPPRVSSLIRKTSSIGSTKQVKKKRKSTTPNEAISTSVAPTRSFGNIQNDDHQDDSESEEEHDEGFSGFERISTPERFKSFDKVHSPGMVSDMDSSDHENRSFNVSPLVMNRVSSEDHDDDNSFLLGGDGGDFMDSSYDNHYSTATTTSTTLNQSFSLELEEQVKKLTENLTKESERANLLSLEKNYLETQLKEQHELNTQQKLSHDKLIDELSQQLQQISTDQLENTRLFIEREERFKSREEELYNREQEISSRQYLLNEKESKLLLEQDELSLQKFKMDHFEKELNERMQQLMQSEQDLANRLEEQNLSNTKETNRLKQMEENFNERMQQVEKEIKNKWAQFDTEKNNFEMDIQRRNQEFEQTRVRVELELESVKQLLEQEKKHHQHEIENRQAQLNSLDESINEKLADLEMKQYNLGVERDIVQKHEQELSEKQAQQELQGQHLTWLKSQLEVRECTFEETCAQFNENSEEKERALKLKSDNLLAQLQSISEREATLEMALSKFENEKHQFNETAKKRFTIESQCKLLAQQLNEKQTEFQNALSEWMITSSQDDPTGTTHNAAATATIISSAPLASFIANDDTDNNSQSQYF